MLYSRNYLLTASLTLLIGLCSSFKLNQDLYCNQFTLDEMTTKVIFSKPYGKIMPYFKNADNLWVDQELLLTAIDFIHQRNQNSLIINGNLAEALPHIQPFLKTLNKYKTLEESSPEREEIKNELNTLFKALRPHVKGILEAERTIARQKAHFPGLEQAINSLRNTNGQPLPVYVHAHEHLPLTGEDRSCFDALTLMGMADGRFTSKLIEIEAQYPKLTLHHNAITIHIEYGELGEVLSHEFGHVYYLTQHWESYQNFRRQKGKRYVDGGHGLDDPNGLCAKAAERGKWPRQQSQGFGVAFAQSDR
ncbi:MAG: hypothetical protein AAF598_19930 [Bacteroidota bacterium]